MRLIYHSEAQTELTEAAQFYEQRASTLGAQFLDTIDHAISVIQDVPDRWRTGAVISSLGSDTISRT